MDKRLPNHYAELPNCHCEAVTAMCRSSTSTLAHIIPQASKSVVIRVPLHYQGPNAKKGSMARTLPGRANRDRKRSAGG